MICKFHNETRKLTAKYMYANVSSHVTFFISGIKIPQLLDAILTLLPLDTYVDSPVSNINLVFFSSNLVFFNIRMKHHTTDREV